MVMTYLFKKRMLVLPCLLSLFAFVSCNDIEQEPIEKSARIILNREIIAFSYKASTTLLTINSSESWFIEIDDNWVTVDVQSGEGNKTVTLAVVKNETGENRETTVYFKIAEDEYSSVKITQASDNRVFMDVEFSGTIEARENIENAKLIIPYTFGNSNKYNSISAEVTGEVRGTVSVETRKNFTLEQENGVIELIVTGKATNPGLICFTITGIPDLYGEEAQCFVSVTGEMGTDKPTLDISTNEFNNIPETGSTNLQFSITSSVVWQVSTTDNWITNLSPTSGPASLQPQTVSFNVAYNEGEARTGSITVKATGLADTIIVVKQNANMLVFNNDFSGVLAEMELIGKSSTFPGSLTDDYSEKLDKIGLSGWAISPCYLSSAKSGKGMIRTGATSKSGSVLTPTIAELGTTPTDIKVNFIAGLQNKAYNELGYKWIEVKIIGDGSFEEGVFLVSEYDNVYTASNVITIPAYVVTGLDNIREKECTLIVRGATANTQFEFKSTNAVNHCFLFGDFKVSKLN